MIVKELIEALQKVDRNAHVVINGNIVTSIVEITGRIPAHPMNRDEFKTLPQGREKGITFTHWTELSTGEQSLTTSW